MSEYELTYPTPDGKTSDRSIAFHVADPDMFKILTYWGYSPGTGEYSAIESTWKFVKHEEKIRLHLEEASVKYPHAQWRSNSACPAILLSDVHLRLAREQYRIRTKKQRCKLLILNPSSEYYAEGEED